MNMYTETYKRLKMSITEFDVEDVITTSDLELDDNELGVGGQTNSTGRSGTYGSLPGF